jgi:Mu-like prophage major head subunit gpT
MPSRSSNFSNLIAPEISNAFFNKYNQWPDEYASVFNLESSSQAYEIDTEVTGLGQFVSKAEGNPIAYDDPIQGKRKQYTHITYGLGFRVTNELYQDDLYGVIKKMPQALARSAHQTIEVQSWNIFNNAFNTGYPGLDGVNLISTAHPNVSGTGGPYSNRLSTDADLSVTSLQAGIQLMELVTDDRDLNMMIRPKLLVVSTNQKWMARELLNSEFKPGTGDNEINAFKDEDLSYMVSHYLTSTHSWYLVADKADHYLKFYWRQKLQMDNDDDFDTGDAKFKATMRFSVGFSGWRGIVGSSTG